MDWHKIKAEYIAGGTSYRKLAEKYGISRSKLQAVATKENWVDLKSQTQAKTESKLVDSISDKESKKATNIIDVADKLVEKIYEMLSADVTNAQSIKSLTSALRDLKEIKGYKSEADMREQEARIAKLQREAQQMSGDEDDDNTGVLMLPEADAPLVDKEESRE